MRPVGSLDDEVGALDHHLVVLRDDLAHGVPPCNRHLTSLLLRGDIKYCCPQKKKFIYQKMQFLKFLGVIRRTIVFIVDKYAVHIFCNLRINTFSV